MSKLVEKPDISLEEILRGTTDLLPPAWQYPKIACARMIFDGREFKTRNFKETPWRQSADIKVHGKRAGTVEVYYLEEKPKSDEGPFLKEERDLINAVAERLGRITEGKKAEETLRESEEKWRSLVENAPNFIMVINLDSIIEYINRTVSGFTKEETIGKSIYDFIEQKYHNVAGETINQVLKTGKPSKYETKVTVPQVGTYWYETLVGPLERDSKIIGATLISTDITERKKAEEELRITLEKVQVLNEKLGVVGRLTRHDVRNKLSAVTGNVFLAKKKLPPDHEALEHLSEIKPAIRQVQEIFDFARTYEKLGVEELVYLDVEKSVGEAVSLFSDSHGVKVVNDCHGLTVLADSLLRQLFYNLIDNSLRYGEKVGQIRVCYEEAGKDKLKLVYEDDGVGIPKPEKEKIFKEGYGKGTGYGLHLIRKICEVYGWTIKETGKHGKGAQFTITIPKIGENQKTLYKLH